MMFEAQTLMDHLDRIADIVAVVVPALYMAGRWANRWLGRIKSDADFTKTVAKTHLPHVYYRLRRSDDKLGLPVQEHPDIIYVNGSPTSVKTP